MIMPKPVTDTAAQKLLLRAIELRRKGRFRKAREVALELANARPGSVSAWHTLGQIYTELGFFDLALSVNQEAMRLLKSHGWLEHRAHEFKTFQTVALGLAISLMRFGRFSEAWPYWEAGRLEVSWSPWPGARYFGAGHDACGSPGSSLLVQSEGGYGDTFMFLRWLPFLKTRLGFSKVGLMIWKPLVDFCDWQALGVDEVYAIDRDNAPFDWQFATSIMSLPAVFGMTSWDDIPPVPEMRKQTVHDVRLDRGEEPFRIGFCWRAEENTSPVRTKSLPVEVAQAICERLLAKPSIPIEVLSLSPQKADLYNSGEFDAPVGLRVEPTRMTDWSATADYMAGMDFILTVDTAVAHLAGLLGIPALVLLPVSSCWRWGRATQLPHPETSPWYGPQLQCYRQSEPLLWRAEDILAALDERIGFGL